MAVTIVANGFSEETRQILQEEANKLADQNYSVHAIMEHIANARHVATSLTYTGNKPCVNCHAIRR